MRTPVHLLQKLMRPAPAPGPDDGQIVMLIFRHMNVYLLLLLLVLNLPLARGQTAKMDSLDRLIRQASTDTGRINRLNAKIGLLGENDIDAAIKLSLATSQEAHRLSYTRGQIKADTRLAFFYCLKGRFAEAKRILFIAEQNPAVTTDSMSRCDIYAGFGVLFGLQSRYDSAGYYFGKAIAMGERIHHPNLRSYYQNIAVSYQMQSNHRQALTYQQKALTLAEKAGDASSKSYSLMNMGLTYKTMGDLDRAEKTLGKAASLARQTGTRNVELYAYSNLASLYESQRNYPKAYLFARQAATLGKQIGDQGIQAASLAKAASALAHQHQFADADKLIGQAQAVASQANQPFITYQVYVVVGEIQQLRGQYGAAIPYYEKGFTALRGSDIYEEQIGQSYRSLSECYTKMGDYRKALSTYKTATEITDSVRSRENIRKATELTMNADFERKQLAAKAEQQQANAVTTVKQYALLGGLVLTLILAMVAFNAYRTKQKANLVLHQQKEAIQHTLTELKTTQERLIHQEKMASLGELTAGIAHEIQNPLNFVNNFAEVSAELVDELAEEQQRPDRDTDLETELLTDIRQNLLKINQHGKRAGAIVKGMLAHSRPATGTKEKVDLNALASEYLQLAYHGLQRPDYDPATDRFAIHLHTDFDSGLGRVDVLPQDMGRVLLNLYHNAFYTVQQKQRDLLKLTGLPADAPYQPTVSVRTRREQDQVIIEVGDNGTGISDSVKAKIFQPFFTTKPTGEGTGLGLSLSYDIITKGHGGVMSVESKVGQYTTIRIQLPT